MTLFEKIIAKQIPAKVAYEDERYIVIHDISPQAPVHVLVIPKGPYVSMADFTANATTEEIAEFFRAVGKVAEQLGLVERGYRVLANHGADAHQEVPHQHVHLFAGAPLGPMLRKVGG